MFSSSTACIPYIAPITAMEFVKSEVERGISNGTLDLNYKLFFEIISSPDVLLSKFEMPTINCRNLRSDSRSPGISKSKLKWIEGLTAHSGMLGGGILENHSRDKKMYVCGDIRSRISYVIGQKN